MNNDDDGGNAQRAPAESPLTLRLLSDLHLERPGAWDAVRRRVLEPNESEDARRRRRTRTFLALCGDVGYPRHENYRTFLRECADRYARVFVVAGNHEFYGGVYQDILRETERICASRDNLHFLHRASVDPPEDDDLRVVGCTLWGRIPTEETDDSTRRGRDVYPFSDYCVIRWRINDDDDDDDSNLVPITPRITNQLCASDRVFLRSEIRRAAADGKKLLVLTHHAPTERDHGVRFVNLCGMAHAHALYTDCEDLLTMSTATTTTDNDDGNDNPIKWWCFGHTHMSGSYRIGNALVVSNQMGYLRNGQSVDRNFHFDFTLRLQEEDEEKG